MSIFIGYNEQTGRILWSQQPVDIEGFRQILKMQGQAFVEVDPTGQAGYVDPTTRGLKMRPALEPALNKTSIAADGQDYVDFGELPAGTIVQTDGPFAASYEHSGGPFHFATTIVGSHTITVEAFPYRRTTFVIEATP